MNIESKCLDKKTSISVILPEKNGFLKNTEKIVSNQYKTLYLLHGALASDETFLRNTSVQKYAEDNGIAVILPYCGDSFYVDNVKSHTYYGKYVGRELLDITRNILPLSDKREDTFIAGFSMGGYGAIINGLKHCEKFSKIGMISSALIIDNIVNCSDDNYLVGSKQLFESIFGNLDELQGSDRDPKALIQNCNNIPDIFIACGVDDFLYETNLDFYEFLKSEDIDAIFIEDSGEHTWEFCDKYIKEFIKTLI